MRKTRTTKTKQLKVWAGGYGFKRTIVAAYTQKQAMSLINASYNYFKDCFMETGNDNELATATEVGVWETVIDLGYGYVANSERQYNRIK